MTPEPPAATAPSMVAEVPGTPASPTTTSYAPPTVVEPDMPAVAPVVPVNTVTPTTQPIRARPISGGTLRVLADGRTAVASDPDRDQVYVVDLVAGKLSTTVPLAPGDEPGRIVEDAAGRVHVALRSGGAVATIDPTQSGAAALLSRRALCAAPRGLAYDKDTDELHVACAGGELVSVGAAPTATTPLRTVDVERDLRDVVVSTNGRVLVSTFRTAEVVTVEADGTMSAHRSLSAPVGAKRNPSVAWRMIGRSDGSSMVLHELALPTALGVFPGAYGVQSSCGGIVTSTVTVVAPDGDASVRSSVPFVGALVAADVAVSPGGTQLAVVSIANSDAGGQVQFFDVTNGGTSQGCWPQSSPTDDAGDVTGDGLPSPSGYLPPNGQVVAVAYDARGNVIVQSREPAQIQVLTQRRDAIALSSDSRFDLGHQLFHSATSGQVACVSCHPEGGEDGRVWTFQTFGARRTQSLRGGIMDTAPFHWSGDEANMSNLMKDVFQGRMAGGTVDVPVVSALTQWIDQIPTIPTSRPATDPAAVRGAALFKSTGCVTCHAGADFTNGLSVDVGTGGTFQVPQLHGVSFRAPYMHNGCAATLRDRFTTSCGGSNLHAVGALTDAQVTDLTAYLETL
jgi:hypothetical protein